jgi:hypothetical protein
MRKEGEQCECDEGWSGVNCNSTPTSILSGFLPLIWTDVGYLDTLACQTDDACTNFHLPGWNTDGSDNMTCYKGGNTVRENFQMCDVTSKYAFLALYRILGFPS